MGFLDSWIAFKGVDSVKLLEHLGMAEGDATGWAVEVAEPFSYCDLPNGWTVIFSNNIEWASDARVRELSGFGFALGCRLNDRVDTMETVVFAVENGEELWRVSAYGEDLTSYGALPSQFAALRESWTTDREAKGEEREIHEIPVELAKSICGFRADDDQPDFTGLKALKGGPSDLARRSGCAFILPLAVAILSAGAYFLPLNRS
jgi:hypothetical protein